MAEKYNLLIQNEFLWGLPEPWGLWPLWRWIRKSGSCECSCSARTMLAKQLSPHEVPWGRHQHHLPDAGLQHWEPGARRIEAEPRDMGAQQSLRSYWRNWPKSTDGLLWVVDSTDRQRSQTAGRSSRARGEGAPGWSTLPHSANKQDPPGALFSKAIHQARSWAPSTDTTGAPGRSSYLSLNGSSMTFPAISSQPAEPLQMPLTSHSSPHPSPH